MTTDRELLELAAKAAGAEYEIDPMTGAIEIVSEIGGVSGVWNPLTDDGDALRLAVKLSLEIAWGDGEVWADGERQCFEWSNHNSDQNSALRRAIVKASLAHVGGAA